MSVETEIRNYFYQKGWTEGFFTGLTIGFIGGILVVGLARST